MKKRYFKITVLIPHFSPVNHYLYVTNINSSKNYYVVNGSKNRDDDDIYTHYFPIQYTIMEQSEG